MGAFCRYLPTAILILAVIWSSGTAAGASVQGRPATMHLLDSKPMDTPELLFLGTIENTFFPLDQLVGNRRDPEDGRVWTVPLKIERISEMTVIDHEQGVCNFLLEDGSRLTLQSVRLEFDYNGEKQINLLNMPTFKLLYGFYREGESKMRKAYFYLYEIRSIKFHE